MLLGSLYTTAPSPYTKSKPELELKMHAAEGLPKANALLLAQNLRNAWRKALLRSAEFLLTASRVVTYSHE